MANASIGGMISGLDTATIISQLMQLEARSQTQLKGRVTTQQRQVTSLQTVNAKLANIATKAADLAKTTAWTPTSATSTNDKVTVTATGTAVPATLALAVGRLATPYSVDYGTHALTDKATADGSAPVVLSVNGRPDPIQLDTKDGSVKGLADAINSADTGLRATLVKQTDGSYRLNVATAATGTAAGFSLTDGQGNPLAIAAGSTPTAGEQAAITIGADTIKSDSNTFSGLMPGVDVTLQPGVKTGDTATVSVARDAKGMTATVKSLVDNLNGALDEIGSLTAYGAGGKSAGILAGDSTLRGVRDQLLSAITGGVGGKSLSTFGIEVDRYGKVTFDEAIFQKAYETDPVGTSAAFTSNSDPTSPQPASFDGLAVALKRVADTASNSTTGTVTSAIKGRTESIDDMNDAIDSWDVRLETKRLALQRQYAALEVALGSLQNQSSWLAGQIAGLPKMNSGS